MIGDDVRRRDAGAECEIEVLTEHGLTRHECGLLRDSKLQIATIGDLERVLCADGNWYRTVKGVGVERAERMLDALEEFRLLHPEPESEADATGYPPGEDFED